MIKSSFRLYKELTEIYNETTCTCTLEQETGEDSSICKSCRLGGALNEIGEIIREKAIEFGINLSI